jgi:hypothetical protein
MDDNLAYVLKAKEGTLFEGNYISTNNCFTGKIRAATIYHDEMYAKHRAAVMEEVKPPYQGYKKDELEVVPVIIQEA